MKYMLMMNCPKDGYETLFAWPKEAVLAHMAFMHAFNDSIRKSGNFVSAEGLANPREAKLVRAAKNGAPVTDGPFAETKEFLAGFWIVQVDTPEQAYQLAARVSTAPGPDGKPLNMPIEVREVPSGPPPEFL